MKKITARKGPGRLRSWFGGGKKSLAVARRAVIKRKAAGIEHVIAQVTYHGGEIVYYVGKKNLALALRDRFEVVLVS